MAAATHVAATTTAMPTATSPAAMCEGRGCRGDHDHHASAVVRAALGMRFISRFIDSAPMRALVVALASCARLVPPDMPSTVVNQGWARPSPEMILERLRPLRRNSAGNMPNRRNLAILMLPVRLCCASSFLRETPEPDCASEGSAAFLCWRVGLV